ncbi:MAG: hypothetical protein ABI462_11825, partial [Ignavibacteria bacterium]
MKSLLRYEALEIFKTLDKKEFSDFQQFLKVGPYLNNIGDKFSFRQSIQRKKQSVKLTKFFTLLKQFYPEFTDLTNAYLIKKMHAQSISSIKKYFMNLKIMCDHFLVLKKIATDKYYYDEALLYQYQERSLTRLFDLKHKTVAKNLEACRSYNVKDFLMKFSIGLIDFMRQVPEIKVKKSTDMKRAVELQIGPSFNLLFYFVFDSITVIVNLIGNANSTNLNLEKNEFYSLFKKLFPDKILEDIIAKAIQLNPDKTTKKIIELYWLNYLFRTCKGKEAGSYFKQYIDILEVIDNKLSINERYDMYNEMAFGFWLTMKYPEFEDEEFRFYDLYLKNKAYKASGKDRMNLVEFKNLILRGDNSWRYDWTTNVMKNHIHELDEDYQVILTYYRNASLYFYRDKNFQRAAEIILKIQKKGNHFLTRDILHLQVLIYYELEYFDSALTTLDSLRKYLVNQNVGAATAIPIKKFITCIRTLIRNNINHTDSFESIEPIIYGEGIVGSKLWLREKVIEQKAKLLTRNRKP